MRVLLELYSDDSVTEFTPKHLEACQQKMLNSLGIGACDPHRNHAERAGAVVQYGRSLEVVPGLVEVEVAVPLSRPAVW